MMKGDPVKGTEGMPFKDAVLFYMKRLKAADKVIKQYMLSSHEDQMGLFESAIQYLKVKQEEKNKRFNEE